MSKDENALVTRTHPRRGLDGPWPPRNAETNPFFRAFKEHGMFEYVPEMPPLEHIFRDAIYPPGSEEQSAPWTQRITNAYRILKIHSSHPGCSSCFQDFRLIGGINDKHSQWIINAPPTPAIHFSHKDYGYEGIMFNEKAKSKLYLCASLTHTYCFAPDRIFEVLRFFENENPLINGPIDFLIPRTGIHTLAPGIVIPGLEEIWIQSDRPFLDGQKFLHDEIYQIHIDKTGISQSKVPGKVQRAGEFFEKEFLDTLPK